MCCSDADSEVEFPLRTEIHVDRGEELLAIYHSHPRSAEPVPSETDIRLAYYPRAVYFIVGLAGPQAVIRAFRISEREERWEEVEYVIAGE